MKKNILLAACCLISLCSAAQNVDIDNYSVNGLGQVQLSIQAESDKYYLLHAQHGPSYNWVTSMMMGVDGTMSITEPGGAYPLENYSITEHEISNPIDWDGDGIDDITEFNNMPTDAPINYAPAVDFEDGATSIPDAETFLELATVNNVGWAPFLDDQLYVKFGILDRDTPEPKVYFINSNTHVIHAGFWGAIGASVGGDDGSGEIVFRPDVIHSNGAVGTYSFNFSFGNAYDFEATQRTYELLLANMPFLQNNLNHFIGQSDENDHLNNYADDFVGTRVEVVLESEVFAEVNYIPFHAAEGYGFFKHMTDLEETPGSRDIVLYDALPNSLPRVGGIITSVIQTPLSHVNLRAIQDNVPNAYIEAPLSIDSIANLLNGYIYYKVESETFQIREATLDEVNAWYEDLRPTEPQIPVRDLSITEIMPLDDIEFSMSTAFGAKCSNVATMRTFGFPEGTIPDGFGIPFYYYHAFMEYNGFYEEAQAMIDNEVFHNDINFRIERLRDLRESIREAPMPQWMLDDLQEMHNDFPEGTAVRCRSSTNNEDLPGFSGAGLYTSKTQHLDEGHIQKSIKQVYASMWNFRAYEERDFYRVDHFQAAMGVLCHPNFQEEKSNGVGISIDPIYGTQGTFYLNTQVGESLITNPDPNSVPEEILLYEDPTQAGGYLVLRLSNLVEPGELVMDQAYLDEMREYLSVIHDEFAELYGVVGAEGFGMDIEYKVTAQDQLAIKQARPWVSFWADITGDNDLAVSDISQPQSSAYLGEEELVTVNIANTGLNPMDDFDLTLIVDGAVQETMNVPGSIEPFEDADFQFTTPQDLSQIGEHNITCIVTDEDDENQNNDTLNVTVSKLHLLDAEIAIDEANVTCTGEIQVEAFVLNQGQTTISNVSIEVVLNGSVIDTHNGVIDAPFGSQDVIVITIDDNLLPDANEVTLNLLSVNGQVDEDSSNDSDSVDANMESEFDVVTVVILADNYPNETSWELIDGSTNQIVATGGVNGVGETFSQDICVNYSSCFALNVYDTYGDGICCNYGEGNFSVLNSSGQTIVYNGGDFGSQATEVFCPSSSDCEFSADIEISYPSSSGANDGEISIYPSGGLSPFQYSIDGGETFFDSNDFIGLTSGTYQIIILSAIEDCTYEEVVTLEPCVFSLVEVLTTHVPSAASSTGSIEISVAGGVAPYSYSIDGGQSFHPTNYFTNLPIGTYNVMVTDDSGVCPITIGVPIIVDETLSAGDRFEDLFSQINIFPNPTDNNFNVAFESPSNEPIIIEVYDKLGRKIDSRLIAQDTHGQITISLEGYGAGTYVVRVLSGNRAQSFKLVKI